MLQFKLLIVLVVSLIALAFSAPIDMTSKETNADFVSSRSTKSLIDSVKAWFATFSLRRKRPKLTCFHNDCLLPSNLEDIPSEYKDIRFFTVKDFRRKFERLGRIGFN